MSRMSIANPNVPYSRIKTERVLEALKNGWPLVVSESEMEGDLVVLRQTFNEYVEFSNCDFRGLDLSECRFNKGFALLDVFLQRKSPSRESGLMEIVTFERAHSQRNLVLIVCKYVESSKSERRATMSYSRTIGI